MNVAVCVLVLADLASALVIDTGSPDAMCPALAQTREAVSARLGELQVAQGGWRANYTITHAPDSKEGDFVRLELFDPDGTLRLERRLPLAGRSCSTMAQAVAVVLERYFRRLAGGSSELPPDEPQPAAAESGQDAPAPAVASEPEPLPAPEPVASPPAPPAPPLPPPPSAGTAPSDHAAAVTEHERRLGATIGGGYATPPGAGALALGARVEVTESTRLGAVALIPFVGQDERVGAGVAELDTYPLRLWLGWTVRRGALSARVGPELYLALDVARARGVSSAETAMRVVPGLGVGAGTSLRLSSVFGLDLEAGLDAVHPRLTSRFVVGGEEVLAPQWFSAFVSAGVTISLPM